MDKNTQYIQNAKRVLEIEGSALLHLANNLDHNFSLAIEAILSRKGHIIVTGMGKSGHIASKIAATLASTGTPAFFVHPAEAAHGDLGMIIEGDIILAISYSGESDELLTILPAIKRKNAFLIAITGNPSSSLAQAANIHINTEIEQEACPNGLAPTTSTTTALALGDALAVSLLKAKKFTADDFALSHPAGRLGKRLLLRVEDIMHKENNLPVVLPHTSIKDAIIMISEKSLGFTAIADHKRYVLGIFTDGDLRRLFQQDIDLSKLTVSEVMKSNPKTISMHQLASEALEIMQQSHINGLLVVSDDQLLVGAINMHDLLQAGIL